MSSVPSRADRTSTTESTACDDGTSGPASRAMHPSATGPISESLEVTPLDTEVLDDIAAGLASVAQGNGERDPRSVSTTLLLSTEAYDAYLMEWGPAAVSDTHDHDGSVGVVHVVSGALVESSQSLDPTLPASGRRLEAGDSTQIPAAQFHRLFNQTGATTVTVNVFSPPIGSH